MLSILNGNSKSKLATSDCDVSLSCRHCTTVSLQAHALLNLSFCLTFQIRYISQTQGLPSDHLLTNGSKSLKFFKKAMNTTTGLLEWKMKVRCLLVIQLI